MCTPFTKITYILSFPPASRAVSQNLIHNFHIVHFFSVDSYFLISTYSLLESEFLFLYILGIHGLTELIYQFSEFLFWFW